MAIIGPGMTDEDYASGKVSALDVFERRIKVWTLGFAKQIAKQEDAGIATLLLASSVFEPMGGAILGKGNSEAKFRAAFIRVFPEVPGGRPEDIAILVCDLLRDGLFHEGFFKAGLILEYGKVPVEQRGTAVVIDPRRFLDGVDREFATFCDELRSASDGSEPQIRFHDYWTKKLGDHAKYMKARFDPQIGTIAGSTSTAAVMPPDMFLRKL